MWAQTGAVERAATQPCHAHARTPQVRKAFRANAKTRAGSSEQQDQLRLAHVQLENARAQAAHLQALQQAGHLDKRA